MRKLGQISYILLEITCHIALALIVFSIIGALFVGYSGMCESYDFASQNCSNSFYKDIGDMSYGIILVTIFTGIPGLLAIGGIFFILRRIHHNKTMKLIEQGRKHEVIRLRTYLLNCFGYLCAAVFVLAVVGKIMSGFG